MKHRTLWILSLSLVLGIAVPQATLTTADAATRKTRTTAVSGKKTTARKGSTARKTSARSTRKRTRKSSAHRAAAPMAFDPARPQTLRAQAAVVVDTRSGEIVWAKNADSPRPIASLTKLMTALVFLDNPRPSSDSITVTVADVSGAGRSHVRAGNRVSIYNLLRCSLISSDNAATRVLARSTGLSDKEFVNRMNERARKMGLYQTHYVEMTGLDPSNQSTAIDQAKLLCAALDNPTVAEITSLQTYSFRCSRRIETLNNTNRLLKSRSDIVGGKTGFIRPAGYCLATLIGDKSQPHLTTVILGAPTNASRFSESAKLIDWAKRALTLSTRQKETEPTQTYIGPATP
jgi:D-alanyl-D-alanine endopeptidase (penicillin-binding protein 7)